MENFILTVHPATTWKGGPTEVYESLCSLCQASPWDWSLYRELNGQIPKIFAVSIHTSRAPVD